MVTCFIELYHIVGKEVKSNFASEVYSIECMSSCVYACVYSTCTWSSSYIPKCVLKSGKVEESDKVEESGHK